MNIISIIMLVLGILTVFGGFVFGFKRGLFKSLIRLLIVGFCIIAAFFLREKIADILLNSPISNGKSLLEAIKEGIVSGENAESMQGLADVIINIFRMVFQIFVFIVIFFILKIISMLVYWVVAGIITVFQKSIAKESLKQKEDEKNGYSNEEYYFEDIEIKREANRRRKKWLGSLMGIAQGVMITACIIGPLNGLIVNVSSLTNSLSNLEINGSKVIDDASVEIMEKVGLFTYGDSEVSKIYTLLGDSIYTEISKVKDENGNVINIKSQIEAIDGGVQMADAVLELSKIDTSNGFTSDTKDQLVDIFNELDEIKESMSEEGVKELDNLIKDVISPMLESSSEELPIDLENINFSEVDFSTEAEVIDTFYDLMEKSENGEELNKDEVLEEVVTTLSDSNLILPVLSQIVENLPEEKQLNLSEEEKSKVLDIIDNLENQENTEKLKELFGVK